MNLIVKHYRFLAPNPPFLALLIRDLPRNTSEADVRSMLKQYTPGYEVKEVEFSDERRYCLVKMHNSKEAGFLLNIFNKISPYLNGSRGIGFKLFKRLKIEFKKRVYL